MTLQPTRRLASLGRPLRSLGSPLNAYPLGGKERVLRRRQGLSVSQATDGLVLELEEPTQ